MAGARSDPEGLAGPIGCEIYCAGAKEGKEKIAATLFQVLKSSHGVWTDEIPDFWFARIQRE